MNKEKSIAVFNTLIETNNDRIAAYEKAIKEAEDGDLKVLFSEFRITAVKCKNELASEVLLMGGIPAAGTYKGGQLLRVWMDFKNTLTDNSRKAILQACRYGEELIVETYNKALRDNSQNLTEIQQTRIQAQRCLLIADSERVKFSMNLLALRK